MEERHFIQDRTVKQERYTLRKPRSQRPVKKGRPVKKARSQRKFLTQLFLAAAYSCSSEDIRAQRLQTKTLSASARSTMAFRFFDDTACAISAQYRSLCIRSMSKSFTLFTVNL